MVAVTYGTAQIATSPAKAAPKGKGFFANLFDAMIEARMQQAYREIALHQHLVTWNEDQSVETK